MRSTCFIAAFLCTRILSFSQSTIDEVLKSYQADKDLKNASFSFCIVEAQSGKVLKDYNPELSLVPASTMKIVTTSAALGILGKNYTYKTKIYFSEKLDSVSGVLNGDIIVKGSGDPTLNSEYFYKTVDQDVLNTWALQLKNKGLKELKGMVITDASCFDNLIPSTWIWGDIGNYFGAGANGLSFCDNKFILAFQSYEDGKQASLLSAKLRPGYPTKDQVQDSVYAGGKEDNAFVFGAPGSNYKTVRGTIPANQKDYEVEAALSDPEHELRDHFEEALDKQGVKIAYEAKNWSVEKNGSVQQYQFNYPDYQLAYTQSSPTLEKIVYYTNTRSNNHYAESLLKTVGTFKSGKKGTTENGIDAVMTYWKGRGVDLSGLFMSDGSGLSRANAITTKIQATILSKIYRDSIMYPAFNASLPVAGKNGSMTSLCKGTFAENNLRAKTGYITRARSYCGYVKTKSGRELAFSIIFNNYACSPKDMKLKIERFLVALTEL